MRSNIITKTFHERKQSITYLSFIQFTYFSNSYFAVHATKNKHIKHIFTILLVSVSDINTIFIY